MTRARTERSMLLVCLCSMLAACALLAKSEPLRVRYFTAEVRESTCPAGLHDGAGLTLRLGRVAAASELREQLVFQSSAHEVGYYDRYRWTERPNAYLERALAQALFRQRGVTRVLSGAAPTLDVRLLAFDEVRTSPRAARFAATMVLHDERVGQLEETIEVEQQIDDSSADAAEALVDALSRALCAGAQRISDHAIARLRKMSESTDSPP